MYNEYDIFTIMEDELESVNVTIGKLRMAIILERDKKRLLQLLDRIDKYLELRRVF